MINLAVLGATGSIGSSTLDVVSRHPDRFHVHTLTAHHDDELMFRLVREYQPDIAVMADPAAAERLERRLSDHDGSVELRSGHEALVEVASADDVDYVMAAIVGAAGLAPTLAAVSAGKRVLLANKEALVLAGQVFMNAARESGAILLPIDSEHNAIFQCMPDGYRCGQAPTGVSRIVLTASGGPFRGRSRQQLQAVTPEQAVDHPNWNMGPKVSVDSATLMNKGLEFIEAAWLFNLPPQQIEIIIHPQSMIHSMVCYDDGSVLAELGEPDMRTPIAHALLWPERGASGVATPDFAAIGQLEFEAPDTDAFPCLRLAREAFLAGGTAPAVLNAANEVAVAAFLQQRIGFNEIATVIERCVSGLSKAGGDEPESLMSLDDLLEADAEARRYCEAALPAQPAERRHG